MMYYGLLLSMMRNEKYETSDRLVAWSETREALEKLMEAEKVEPWIDENPEMANMNGTSRYHKTFRKGGLLEWFNSTSCSRGHDFIVEIESPEEFSNRVVREAPEEDIPYLEEIRVHARERRENLLSSTTKL